MEQWEFDDSTLAADNNYVESVKSHNKLCLMLIPTNI